MAGKSETVQAEEQKPEGKASRLSKSLRKHIRRLKAEGRREEAMSLWKAARKRLDE